MVTGAVSNPCSCNSYTRPGICRSSNSTNYLKLAIVFSIGMCLHTFLLLCEGLCNKVIPANSRPIPRHIPNAKVSTKRILPIIILLPIRIPIFPPRHMSHLYIPNSRSQNQKSGNLESAKMTASSSRVKKLQYICFERNTRLEGIQPIVDRP